MVMTATLCSCMCPVGCNYRYCEAATKALLIFAPRRRIGARSQEQHVPLRVLCECRGARTRTPFFPFVCSSITNAPLVVPKSSQNVLFLPPAQRSVTLREQRLHVWFAGSLRGRNPVRAPSPLTRSERGGFLLCLFKASIKITLWRTFCGKVN